MPYSGLAEMVFGICLVLFAFGTYCVAVYKPAADVHDGEQRRKASNRRFFIGAITVAILTTSFVATDLYRLESDNGSVMSDGSFQFSNLLGATPWLMLAVTLFTGVLFFRSITQRKGNSWWKDGVWMLGSFALFVAAIGTCGGTFGMASPLSNNPVWVLWTLAEPTALVLSFIFVPYAATMAILYYGERQRAVGAAEMARQLKRGEEVYVPPVS